MAEKIVKDSQCLVNDLANDCISRQAAIDALRYAQHRFTVADEAGGMGTVKWSEDVIYFAAAERVLSELPSAQQERIIYGNMSDEEFEKWLYGHGICSPNIHESIPCDAVPLLIDNAISELPSAQPEIIRCKDCKFYRQEIDMCDEPYSTAHNVVHEDDFCSKAERKEHE